MHEEVPDREVAHFDAAVGEFRPDCPQRKVRLLGQTRQQPLSLAGQRANGRRPPTLWAAALPVARNRCDHFTTLATLTLKVAATARQLSPPATAATTLSRRSSE
jgi:hypothetical protein